MFTKNAVYILSTMFAVGILTLLIINPMLDGYIKPALLNTATPAIQADIEPGMDFAISMVKLVPYAIFFTSIVYLLVLIFRKEEVAGYV